MNQLTLQQAFDLALQHHQSGRLQEAQQLYRQILAQQPTHAGALHYLGVMAYQLGRPDVAADLIRQALAVMPNWPDAHSNLGAALQARGRLDEAIAAYRHAVALKPDWAEGHSNLGNALNEKREFDEAIAECRQALTLKPGFPEASNNLGNALHARGQLDEAIASFRQALALRVDYAEAYNNLASALQANGQLDQAIGACRQALAVRPDYPDAHGTLGNTLQAKGQLDEAIVAYRQALALKPNWPEAYGNLGAVLQMNGQLDEAIAAYRQAIALKPDYPEAISNFGNALKDKGQLDEAIAACRRAIGLKPNYPEAYSNLGRALQAKGQLDEAIAAYRQALVLMPDFAEAHNNLGSALQAKGSPVEAIAALRQALALKPNYPEAYINLGSAWKDQGQLDEAITAYRQAIAFKPSYHEAHSNLVFCLHYHPGFDAAAIAQELRRWNQQHAEPLRPFIQPHANDRNPGRRLRIGYVSPDFREHVVARFLLPLLANHDRQLVEIFAYAQAPVADAMTQRLRGHTDAWRSLVGLSDAQAADLIRQDGIDILVDLAGHTAQNRLLVFARKPAPVQVTYLGYPDTTGLSTMDYRLTDAYADPPGQSEPYCSEQLVRLSPCAWCFQPVQSPPVAQRPDGSITFGCFNTFAKVTEPMLKVWGRILLAVPESRLLLKAAGLGSASVRQRVQQVIAEVGIDRQRLELRGCEADYGGHLALYGRVDVALDCFPYHGTTTTCEALWMGAPVVSLAGLAHVSRVGVSLLSNIGLPELVANTPEQYVQIASELATDLPRLKELRGTLRQRMAASPLMDAPNFVRGIEEAYRQMWWTWCAAA